MQTAKHSELSSMILSMCLSTALTSAVAWAQCQNQIEIDVCKAGCTATSDVCGALCGAAVDVCTGACIGGCAIGCAIDCCGGFCPNSSACRACIGSCEDDCEAGCALECDDCIFNCERDCESICRPYRTIGEFCTPVVDRCADGLVCWWLPFPGEARPRCFADEGDDLYPDDVCRAFYSPALHQGAIDLGLATTYGTGSSFSAVISATQELGVVYGPDGEFGCYVSQCLGGISDVEISTYAAVGFFISYADMPGEDIAIVEGAGSLISFSTSQILNTSGELVGTADSLSIGAGLSPIAVGVYDCVTILDTVGRRNPTTGALDPVDNSPPVAICADRSVCADAGTCVADADINNGSADPDGHALNYAFSPAGPYEIGVHNVDLTVADPDGEDDRCSATVTVGDCTPPGITCPQPIEVFCDRRGGALVDPGDATTEDCTSVSITDPGTLLFPVGSTEVNFVASDAAGNETSCQTTVTVVDSAPPTIESVAASPAVLWPPNQQMVEVSLEVIATDVCDPTATCGVEDVTIADHAQPGHGNPHAPEDFEILDATTVLLRAERSGNGPGRVYTIEFSCQDDAGNGAGGTTTVIVPHDLGDANSARDKPVRRNRAGR